MSEDVKRAIDAKRLAERVTQNLTDEMHVIGLLIADQIRHLRAGGKAHLGAALCISEAIQHTTELYR